MKTGDAEKESRARGGKAPPPQLRIALFGESGSGKTTLIGSFFGRQQSESFMQRYDYYLDAKRIEDTHELLQIYFDLQNDHRFPASSVKSRVYSFEFKVKKLKHTALEIELVDYPGGWWQREPADATEQEERIECLRSLLRAHVGILLVDAARYKEDGGKYLRQLFTHFMNVIRRLKEHSPDQTRPPIRHWVIALNKAGLMEGSGYTVRQFRNEVIDHASQELQELQSGLGSDGLEIGGRFLLLSSVHVNGGSQERIDVNRSLGLELLAPITTHAVLAAIYQDAQAELRKTSKTPWILWIRQALTSSRGLIDKYLPPDLKAIGVILTVTQGIVSSMADRAEDQWKQRKSQAISKERVLEAAVATMQELLHSSIAERLYYYDKSLDEPPPDESAEKE